MRERRTTIKDTSIRYLESESNNEQGNKRNVLLIHGLGSSADRWSGILDYMSSRYHTVALDLPGFGKSDKPSTEYTINMFRDVVIDFLYYIFAKNNTSSNSNKSDEDDNNETAKASIIGHSLGGYIAAEVAILLQQENGLDSHYPIQLEKLVLVDPSGMLVQPTPLLEQFLDSAMNPSQDKVRKVFEKMVADPRRVSSFLVESFIENMDNPNAKHSFESTLRNSASTQIGLDRLATIGNIPTLILWGRKDHLIPLQHSRFFRDSITNSRLEIIEDAGHAPFAEKPQQFLKILTEFL